MSFYATRSDAEKAAQMALEKLPDVFTYSVWKAKVNSEGLIGWFWGLETPFHIRLIYRPDTDDFFVRDEHGDISGKDPVVLLDMLSNRTRPRESHMNVRIILKARYIPDGTAVCKPTGNKSYILNREMKIYDTNKREVSIIDGIVLSDGETLTIIPEEKELAVTCVDIEGAREFINKVYEEVYG